MALLPALLHPDVKYIDQNGMPSPFGKGERRMRKHCKVGMYHVWGNRGLGGLSGVDNKHMHLVTLQWPSPPGWDRRRTNPLQTRMAQLLRLRVLSVCIAKIPSFIHLYGNIHRPCTCSAEVQLVFVCIQREKQTKTSCISAEQVQGLRIIPYKWKKDVLLVPDAEP